MAGLTKLSDLGFDGWFEAQGGDFSAEGCAFARVTAVDRGACLVSNELGEIPAELAGKLSFRVGSTVDLPCVGDWVAVRYHNDGGAAIIHGVLPRRTFLRRRAAGERVDFQMIAANIDTAFIVQSCHYDFNVRRLDRYLVMAADGQVEPIVLLTKTDLVTPEELEQRTGAIRSKALGAGVLALSTVTGDGFDRFRQLLAPGRTYCLLGSSGVGKTTLINRLIGRDAFVTKAVSGTGEGVHATVRRQLIVLDGGAMLIDTPGMRELGLLAADDGLSRWFEETVGPMKCRYADCTHEHEPGCAVRAAVSSGELEEEHYASYMKLRKESEYHELSYLDRRKKDRDFGRFIKTVKKQMRK